MTMKNTLLFFFALLVVVFSSCDKIDAPYGQAVPTTAVNDTEVVMRKVFIEDFTGQTCGNCELLCSLVLGEAADNVKACATKCDCCWRYKSIDVIEISLRNLAGWCNFP